MIIMGTDKVKQSACLKGAVLAFGVFDGCHLGHQFLFEQARKRAEELGAPFVILTFDKDPDELFAQDRLQKLCSNKDRLALLEKQTPSAVAVLDFTKEFSSLSPAAFLDLVFGNTLPAQVFIGADFRFGNRASGTVETLQAWGVAHGVGIQPQSLYEYDGQPVTATRIRTLLQSAQLDQANILLGRMHAVRGTVYEGRQQGRDFGFKTANLSIAKEYFVLAEGVYAGYVEMDGQRWRAAISLGVAPTFEEAVANCEVHILDFDGDIYGQEITVLFHSFLRPMMKFSSTEELIKTVMGNIETARSLPL